MTNEPTTSVYLVRHHPRRSLVRNGLLSFLLVTIPVFGLLGFLSPSANSWTVAILGELLFLTLGGILFLFYRRTFVGITATTIEERGFWGGRTSTPRSELGSVVLADTFHRASPDTVQQLIVRDRAGQRIVRMRGFFWTPKALHEVADTLDLPMESPAEEMDIRDFFARYPGSAYWFENRPVITAIAVVVVLAALTGLILGLMFVLDLPVETPLESS